MWSKLSLFFILLSICLISEAKDYRFAYLTKANGLSQSEVYTFLEDRNGFMWIGTLDGLNKYDGYSFEIFNTNKNNKNSLSNNTVRCLAEDQLGRIWIGTDDGLDVYDQGKELIYRVKLDTTEEKLAVWSLIISDDHLLIGTSNGLWRGSIKSKDLNEVEKNFFKIKKYSNKTGPNVKIRTLTPCKSGGIWVMTGYGISRIFFHANENEPSIVDELSYPYFFGKIDMEEDSLGCIWIACTGNSIFRYDPEKKSLKNITLNNAFLENFSKKYSTLTIDHSKRIWVGTSDKGLLCIHYDFEKDEIKNVETIQKDPNNSAGLNSNLIFSTYVSSTNMLWVGTVGSGVNILDPGIKKIDHYRIESLSKDSPSSNFIRAVMVDKQNRILAGIQNNGLYLIDRETKQSIKLGFDTQTVFYISEYLENLYFVCSSNGIFLIELNGSTFRIVNRCEGFKYATFYVEHCRNDIYWCATLGGLIRIKVNSSGIEIDGKIDKSTKPALSDNNCRVLHFDDAKNQLIVGTQGGGLNYIQLDDRCNPVDNKVYEVSDDTNSLSNNHVRSIYQDKKKDIWIGTHEGLNKVMVDTNTGERSFKTYTRTDGLPNNMIEFIVEDDKNNLWLGTNGGLSKFTPKNESFVNYNMEDGLQSDEFSEHTVYKTSKGELVMGGINGINALFPENIKNSTLKPRTLITDFYLNNKKIKSGQEVKKTVPLPNSILFAQNIELSPESKNIGFKFSAMIYPYAGKVQYAYMLEGFDKEWMLTDALNRNIHYTNLRHGKYTFKVKATNTDGVWDENPTTIQIKIKTPFLYSWVAIILYVLFFILLFVYFSHYTVIGLTTKRNLILEKEHSEKLHKFDELRTRFFINISHDLRTPLTLISGPLNSILTDNKLSGELKDNLLLIKRNVKRLTDLIEQLLDIRKAEMSKLTPKFKADDFILFTKNEIAHFSHALNKKGLELKFEFNEDPLWLNFDPTMLSKVYFNIISNAIKYTSAGYLKIKIEKVYKNISKNNSELFIQVEISDTGIGISKENEKLIFERFYQDNRHNEQGYGIGLSHTKDIIEAHNGFIEAESVENSGTTIRFFIPDTTLLNSINNQDSYSTEDLYINEEVRVEDCIESTDNELFKHVLVVEDNTDMLNFIKNSLKKQYNVILASDGAEGLKIAKEKMPDLILSDVMMPRMDGIEFCKEIKTNINTSHIPVILLTAKVDLKTKYEGIETGADDFIPKPFEMEYLLLRIKNLLQSRENLRKLFQRSTVLEPSAITVTTVDEKFLSALISAIEERMSDENFTINSLESILGMSHTSFYRKIKTLTGQSAQEFLLTFRIKRAYQILLENKGIRISEVAFMVGFSSHTYFTKCFKEVFGYAPSEIKYEA